MEKFSQSATISTQFIWVLLQCFTTVPSNEPVKCQRHICPTKISTDEWKLHAKANICSLMGQTPKHFTTVRPSFCSHGAYSPPKSHIAMYRWYFFLGAWGESVHCVVVIWAAAVKVNLWWNDCEKLLLARWEIVGCIQRNLSLPICSQWISAVADPELQPTPLENQCLQPYSAAACREIVPSQPITVAGLNRV